MATIAHRQPNNWNAVVSRSTLPVRLSISWIVRKLLVAAFLVSFLQYWTFSLNAQFVHVVLILLSGLVVLAGSQRQQRMQNLLRGGALLVVAVLFTEVISYYSGDRYSLLYGAALLAVMLSARLVVQQIGLHEVLRTYSQAGIIVVCFLAVAGRRALLGYNAGERFSGNGSAHPNLVAFLLAGYLPVLVWRALECPPGRKRIFLAAISFMDALFIFLAGSRGALLAILVGGIGVALRLYMSGRLKGRVKLRHVHILIILVGVPLLGWFLLHGGRLAKVEDFFNTALSLNSSERGLKSGLSGRTVYWAYTIRRISEENRWLFGFGFRMGDILIGTIDNGYIQLLFETGLISGVMIFGVLVGVFIRLWRMTRNRHNDAWFRYHYVLWSLILIYLVNNISTRYLLSFGNSFSILVIFMMVSSEKELRGRALLTSVPKRNRRWLPRVQPVQRFRRVHR